jgi:hypothetical protein
MYEGIKFQSHSLRKIEKYCIKQFKYQYYKRKQKKIRKMMLKYYQNSNVSRSLQKKYLKIRNKILDL